MEVIAVGEVFSFALFSFLLLDLAISCDASLPLRRISIDICLLKRDPQAKNLKMSSRCKLT